MLQREIRHPAGTFPRCRCGAEPRHIQAHGALSDEPCDPFHPAGVRHSLECHCGPHQRTRWLPTLEAATADWRDKFAAPVQRASVRPILRLHKQETA